MSNIPYIHNILSRDGEIIFFQEPELCGASINLIKLCKEKNKRILELEKKVNYDELTGLLNRYGLEKKIKEQFNDGEHITLISLDLENLTKINNLYGYLAGDDAIKKMAEILKKNFRFNGKKSKESSSDYRKNGNKNNEDIICRYGGDEFIIILKKLDIKIVQERIKHILNQVKQINEEQEYHFGVHIGVICDYIIENYKIANEVGLKQAKGNSLNNLQEFNLND